MWIPQAEETRRAYRELIVTTPGLGEFISGVILYDGTIRQSKKDGTPFVKVISDAGIIPGIKVDAGALPLDLCRRGWPGKMGRLLHFSPDDFEKLETVGVRNRKSLSRLERQRIVKENLRAVSLWQEVSYRLDDKAVSLSLGQSVGWEA